MLKSHASLRHPTWDMNQPSLQRLHVVYTNLPVSHLEATLVDCACILLSNAQNLRVVMPAIQILCQREAIKCMYVQEEDSYVQS